MCADRGGRDTSSHKGPEQGLTVVCWLYASPTGHRSYGPEHVQRLIDQFSLNYSGEHRFLCITDIEGVPCDTLDMPVVLPNNYRRLWLFSREAAEKIPGRVFQVDLDIWIRGNLDSYLDRSEPLVLMTDPMYPDYRYSSSFLLDTGSRTDIWDAFDLRESPKVMDAWFRRVTGKRQIGSDMAWLSYYLRDESLPTFVQHRARLVGRKLPRDAKIIHFSGGLKPWDKKARIKYPWLKG